MIVFSSHFYAVYYRIFFLKEKNTYMIKRWNTKKKRIVKNNSLKRIKIGCIEFDLFFENEKHAIKIKLSL